SKKGLINQVSKGRGSRRVIKAEYPEKFALLLKQKKDQIEIAEKKLPDFITGIAQFTQSAEKNSEIDVRYYKGKNEVRFIYEEALKAKEFRAFLNCKKFAGVFPNNQNQFIHELIARPDMQMWEIVEDSAEAIEYIQKMPVERYFCKVAPKHVELTILDYMIFDGKVGIVDFSTNATGTLICSNNVYTNTKAIFDFIWQALEPYNKESFANH
ncbi:MAG: hypothetical protein KKA99_05345, partial [Gammaproteobacteria bacterium]|nr:hypothetical protein [Gammaproteobacteria bacterium]